MRRKLRHWRTHRPTSLLCRIVLCGWGFQPQQIQGKALGLEAPATHAHGSGFRSRLLRFHGLTDYSLLSRRDTAQKQFVPRFHLENNS